MWKTVLRRVLIMIPEIIILSVFVFILAKMMPGDPFTGAITPQTSPARIHELKVQAGLYDPWYVQYGRWITNLFHGDLGISYQFKTPVAGLIASRAGNTLWLSLVIVVLSYLFAIPLGIIAGRFENSKSDRVIQLYNYISYAIPGFVFYLLGLWLFGYVLGIFPTSGSVSIGAGSGFGYVMSRRPSSIDISCAIRSFRLRHLPAIRLPACLADRFLLKLSFLILGWACCSLTR